ncbi:hypothetical protein T4D_2006 [Trichinella pseudospiralis]|uniref:Uncharacterized protein n=1 Tax=Trichinella pseudospiralis TaxID=6337 RepID=A0A0V1FWW1_TRIPS|nr:hypothetical protein T4D_2006 [Trichinella pseudospiralis]
MNIKTAIFDFLSKNNHFKMQILSLDIISKSGTKHALPIHPLFAPSLFERRILRSRDKSRRCTDEQTEVCAKTECKAEDAAMTELLLEGESDITEHPDFVYYTRCMQRCCAKLNGAKVAPLKEEEKRRGPTKLPFQSIFDVADQKTVERCDATMCKSQRMKYEGLVARTSSYKKLRASQELRDYKECIESCDAKLNGRQILSLDIISKSGTKHALPIHPLFAPSLFERRILRSRDKSRRCTDEQTEVCAKTECKAEDAAMTELLLEGESDITEHPDFVYYTRCMQRCCAKLNGAKVAPLKEGEKRRGPTRLPFQSIFDVADQQTVERCDATMCKSQRVKYESLVARTTSYKKLRASQELRDYKECIESCDAKLNGRQTLYLIS